MASRAGALRGRCGPALHRPRARRRRRGRLPGQPLEAPPLGSRRDRQRRRGHGSADLRLQARRRLPRAVGGPRVRHPERAHPPDQRPRLGPGRGPHPRLARGHRLDPGCPASRHPRCRAGVVGRPRRAPPRGLDRRLAGRRAHPAGARARLDGERSRGRDERVVGVGAAGVVDREERDRGRRQDDAPGGRHQTPDPAQGLLPGCHGPHRVRHRHGHSLSDQGRSGVPRQARPGDRRPVVGHQLQADHRQPLLPRGQAPLPRPGRRVLVRAQGPRRTPVPAPTRRRRPQPGADRGRRPHQPGDGRCCRRCPRSAGHPQARAARAGLGRGHQPPADREPGLRLHQHPLGPALPGVDAQGRRQRRDPPARRRWRHRHRRLRLPRREPGDQDHPHPRRGRDGRGADLRQPDRTHRPRRAQRRWRRPGSGPGAAQPAAPHRPAPLPPEPRPRPVDQLRPTPGDRGQRPRALLRRRHLRLRRQGWQCCP